MVELWVVEFEEETARGRKRRLFEIPVGATSATPAGPLTVSARGEVIQETPWLMGTERGGFTLVVPPRLKGLKAPSTLARWHIEGAMVHKGERIAFSLQRPTGLTFSFGRIDVNALRLPIDELGRRHCVFFVDSVGALWCDDLASPTGTFADGVKIQHYTQKQRVTAGPVTVELSVTAVFS
jgi:hypothetical protein